MAHLVALFALRGACRVRGFRDAARSRTDDGPSLQSDDVGAMGNKVTGKRTNGQIP